MSHPLAPGIEEIPALQPRRLVRTQHARILVMVVVIGVALTLFAGFHQYGYDDPFITYRYALQLARGNGFVYNIGTRVLSTTTPLYTLLLAPLAKLGLSLPVASNALGCLALALGALAFWFSGQTTRTPWAALTGLLLFPTFPEIVRTLGAETAFYTMLLAGSFAAYVHQRYVLVALLLGLATLTRADGLLMAGLLALHFAVVRRELPPWRAALVFALVLAPWIAWAWWYFGAPLPVTLATKRAQGHMAISRTFWQGLRPLLRSYEQQPLYWLHGLLLVVGLGYALWKQRLWLLLPLWSCIYVLAYTGLGVSAYFWYYAPLVAGVVALIAQGVEAAARLIARWSGYRSARWAALMLILALLAPQVLSLSYYAQHLDRRLEVYREVGTWLRTQSPSDASVGALEVGIIGFYSDRRMIDFAGLIQPETAELLTRTNTYDDAALWALSQYRPSHVVIHRGSLPRLEHAMEVGACDRITTFTDPVYPEQLDVYTCTYSSN